MTLLTGNYYGAGLQYGVGVRYGGVVPAEHQFVPQHFQWNRTAIDGIYLFHWTFLSSDITLMLPYLDWTLQIDTSANFNTPNLASYSLGTAFAFQDGDVVKGFELDMAPRVNGVTQKWYARVQSTFEFMGSDFSSVVMFTIPPLFVVAHATSLMKSLPSPHTYNKDGLS